MFRAFFGEKQSLSRSIRLEQVANKPSFCPSFTAVSIAALRVIAAVLEANRRTCKRTMTKLNDYVCFVGRCRQSGLGRCMGIAVIRSFRSLATEMLDDPESPVAQPRTPCAAFHSSVEQGLAITLPQSKALLRHGTVGVRTTRLRTH